MTCINTARRSSVNDDDDGDCVDYVNIYDQNNTKIAGDKQKLSNKNLYI